MELGSVRAAMVALVLVALVSRAHFGLCFRLTQQQQQPQQQQQDQNPIGQVIINHRLARPQMGGLSSNNPN